MYVFIYLLLVSLTESVKAKAKEQAVKKLEVVAEETDSIDELFQDRIHNASEDYEERIRYARECFDSACLKAHTTAVKQEQKNEQVRSRLTKVIDS